MRLHAGGIIGIGALLALSLSISASPTPVEITELVRQLGDDRFAQREAASHALEQIGAPALEPLRQALSTAEPEIRRRAEVLLRAIEQRLERELALQPKVIRFRDRQMRVVKAAQEIMEQSGYLIVFAGDTAGLAERQVAFDESEMTFWEALDRVCERGELTQYSSSQAVQRGLTFTQRWPNTQAFHQGGALVLAAGKSTPVPTQYAGALRLRLLRATPSDRSTDTEEEEVAFTLEVTPEPRLQGQTPLTVQVTEASDDLNQPLSAVMPRPARQALTERPVLVNRNGVVVQRFVVGQAGSTTPFEFANWSGNPIPVPVRLKLPESPGKTLSRLKGVLHARIQTPLHDLITVEDVQQALQKSFKAVDGTELRVADLKRSDNGEVQLQIQMQLTPAQLAARGGINAQMQMQMRMQVWPNAGPGPLGVPGFSNAQFTLKDANGLAYQLTTTRIDETIVNNAFAQVHWLAFRPPRGQAESSPRELVYATSRLVSIGVPFEFTDVPLPDRQE